MSSSQAARGWLSERRHVKQALVVVLFLAPALLAVSLIHGGLTARADKQPVEGGTSATGTIVDIDKKVVGKGVVIYKAQVRFTTGDGRSVTFTSDYPNARPQSGDQVRVSYDPAAPEQARNLDAEPGAWKAPFGAGIAFAVMALVIGAGALVGLPRRAGRVRR